MSYENKARYALTMLLFPLKLRPVWVARAELSASGAYYGRDPGGLPASTLHLPFSGEAAGYFAEIRRVVPEKIYWTAHDGERWPILFQTSEGPDLIASAFFWLSGWQEAATRERDRHGRFPFHASLQARLGCAERPVVEGYRAMLAEQLCAAGLPAARRMWGGHSWALCPTHDIDYLKKWRPAARFREVTGNWMDTSRTALPTLRVERAQQVLHAWAGGVDPYLRAYDRMMDAVVERGGTATYFLKAGASSRYDVPYRLASAPSRKRLKKLAAHGFEIGLHPSYHAPNDPQRLKAERERLSAEVCTEISTVRSHYLRFDPRITPSVYAEAGFRLDSTLGFSEQEGFRHGTCMPFRLYDLQMDRSLDTWEIPVVAMDATLFNKRGFDGSEAVSATYSLMRTVERYGGVCTMIWHNLLWDELDHPGWGDHFIDTLDTAKSRGARIGALSEAFCSWAAPEGEYQISGTLKQS